MKNLKPFDLQAALSGKAVKLRDGRKAYVRYHETELDVNPDYKLLGYDAEEGQLSWRESGSYLSERIIADYDIIGMYPETRIINRRTMNIRTTRIHLTPDSIHHDRAFSIEIADEGAGEYLVIRSVCCEQAALTIDADEWPALRDAIDLMVKNARNE